MNRLEIWTGAVLLGVALAIYDLLTGWTVSGGVLALVVVFGLFFGAFAMYAAMLRALLKERKRILSGTPEAGAVLKLAARAMRWAGVFAIAFSVLLFTNCSGAGGAPNAHVSAAMVAPNDFLFLTAWLMTPLLVALLLPPLLASGVQVLAGSNPTAARRLSQLVVWACALAAVAAVATVPVGFFLGVSSCDVGPSAGYCAAGVGSLLNFFSLGSLALFLPYTGLLTWALARMEYDRANAT
jgi:hypothetical protein